MTLAIDTVIESIADLSVEGVSICDLSDIPVSALRLTPILFPKPGETVSNFTMVRQSFGGGSSALIDVDYDLNYLFLYCESGSGRTGLDYELERMEKVMLIWDAIIGVDTFTGGIDIQPVGNVNFVTVQDPSGNEFLGCQLIFHVKEFWR